MIIANQVFENMLNSSVRSLRGRVEIYQGSTLALICGCHDRLKEFTIERIGESSKFFGFGICQKLNAHLLDKNRELDITTANTLEVEFGVGSDYIYPCPNFYVTEVNRDENTNELSITAYDALYKAANHTVGELDLPASYTIKEFAEACAALLGVPMAAVDNIDSFNTLYPTGANFDGTESIREALNAVAEATQTIYYINSDWELVFKRLNGSAAPVATIDKNKYIKLDSKTNRRLAEIVHATELGDNVSAAIGVSGSTQFVRNNPFWELRDDIGTLVNNAAAAVGGLTINQFECNWRGNYLLEIGDKIELITKDDAAVISFILDDTISFNGSLSGKTRWSYTDNEGETHSNPTNLGEALKQTYARVDKANKQIELLASEVNDNGANVAALRVALDSITTTVSEQTEEINRQAELAVSADDVTIAIKNEMANGVDKVTTATGFTFNESGLRVSKSNSEMETEITEDGMKVYKSGEEVLTADNEGVKAEDLHATTYLIVGTNSRFENYGSNRTGCFWIGG